MIRRRWAWLAAALALGCAPKSSIPEQAIEEMPPWMSREGGEKVRIELIEQLLETGNTIGAIDILHTMRTEGYDTGEIDLLQARALRIDGVGSEAERLLAAAEKRLPRDARIPEERCVLFADEHRVEEAIAQCRRATELDPSRPKSWNNLGFLLLAAERPDEALEAAEQALQIDAGDPKYRNNLAMAQAALGRDEQAFRTFQSTMPRADAANMVAQVVERFRGPEEARAWYDRAAQMDRPAGAEPAEPAPAPVEPAPPQESP
ncbi:MAG: tetratricopeptide repeat protein [Myxococcota bacterium]